MEYREEYRKTDRYKEMYLDGVECLIARLAAKCHDERERYVKDIMDNKDKYRQDFAKMLGWPLTEESNEKIIKIAEEKLSDETEYSIYRMQFSVLGGVLFSGLLFRHHGEKDRPFAIVQHGRLGTPELIGGVYEKTGNYNDMLHRILDKGVNVFAPQLLLWSVENYGVEYDRELVDARLKSLGSSIAALEIYGLMRIIDYFEAQAWVGNIGMAGMSYGGFYTLFTAALDTRIKAALSCSFFCDNEHYVQTDWCWDNMSKLFGEAEVACLIHPRKLLMQMGDQDPLFDFRKSRAEFERLQSICGEDNWAELIIFEGNHEFYKEDCHVEKFATILRNNEKGV